MTFMHGYVEHGELCETMVKMKDEESTEINPSSSPEVLHHGYSEFLCPVLAVAAATAAAEVANADDAPSIDGSWPR